MSIGETDLQRLLAGLSPQVAAQPFAIRTQTVGTPVPADAIMLSREAEGVTAIA